MAAEGVGIHTLGKIDCLVNYHGYFARVDKGFRPQIYVRERIDNKPSEPKVKKLRMASMVKMDVRMPKSNGICQLLISLLLKRKTKENINRLNNI